MANHVYSISEVVGSSHFCTYAALSYGDRAFTIQPHPEFTADFLADLAVARRSALPETVADRALAASGRELAAGAIADRIEAVLRNPRG